MLPEKKLGHKPKGLPNRHSTQLNLIIGTLRTESCVRTLAGSHGDHLMTGEKFTISILGVDIRCLDLDGLVAAFFEAIRSPSDSAAQTFSYANTHVLNMAHQDTAFRDTLNRMDLIYADGIGAVIAGRILNGCRLRKMTGADWIHPLAAAMAEQTLRIFILGGKPGVAEKAAAALLQQYPGLQIAGTADGYFIDQSEAAVIRAVQETRPDALFVGMGSPRQEEWLLAYQAALPVRVVWAVGALFDYLAGEEKRAPRWVLSANLEWLWRLLMNPGGKWQRYLVGNPVFLWRVVRQKFVPGDKHA